MDKPKKKIVEHYDYHECAKYVAHKFGIESLRDVLGKFESKDYDAIEHQDFWHVVLEQNNQFSGGYVYISSGHSCPIWAVPIIKAFEDEFGNEGYYVEW